MEKSLNIIKKGEPKPSFLTLVTVIKRFVTTWRIGSDGEPYGSITVNHKAVAGLYVQSTECRTVGIVAGGGDGIACAVDLRCEDHVAEVAAAYNDRGNRSCGIHAATCNALVGTIDSS